MINKGKTDLAATFCKKYYDLAIKHNTSYSKRFIATVLQSEHPDEFKDVEEARSFVRRALGQSGHKERKSVGSKYDELRTQMAFIEQPIQEIDFKHYILPKGYNKPLFIADLHGLFHDRKAIDTTLNYAIKEKCDCVIILGDFLDNYQHSFFSKSNIIAEQFWKERDWGIDMLKLLQDLFGFVVLKLGNHDGRREKAIEQLPPKFADLIELASYEDYLRFDKSSVKFVEPYNIVQVGKLNCIHGDEIYGGGGIHVAYNRLNKAFDNIISAHSHIISQTPPRATISGEVFGSWTIGCLCNLHPRYNPINQWRHGFAIVEVEDDGMFIVNNRHIIDGRIF